jgi:hypothetical protein
LAPGYREFAAPDVLRGIVACLWVRVSEIAQEVRIVPDGCTDVVWQQGEGTTFVGPDTAAKLVGRVPGDVMVGIRFLPGAGGGALGVPLDAVRDQRVAIAELDRAFDIDGGLAPSDVLARLSSAAAGREADPLVAVAARRITRQRTAAVARDLGISERQLGAGFTQPSATDRTRSSGCFAFAASSTRWTADVRTSPDWLSMRAMPTKHT